MIVRGKSSRKEQVLLQAAELFKQKGYSATSMRDLATSLGIEAASLYSHIKSKEEILQKICFDMATEFIKGLDEVDAMDISASEKLRRGIISHTHVIVKDLAASAVFLNEYRYLSKDHLKHFLLLRIRYINRFKRFIEQGIRDGEFSNIEPKMAVMTIFSSLNWIPNWYEPTTEEDQKKVSNHLADLLINGLKR